MAAAPPPAVLAPPTRKLFLKVIVVGDSGVGKTSLLERYVNRRYSGVYKATLGADFLCRDVRIGDTLVTLQIWDTAGQERFESLNCTYYRGADACVLVFDRTDPESFEKLTAWRSEFMLQGDPPDPDTFPFLVVGNKCDLEPKVSDDAAKSWCAEHDISCKYFATSAARDINVVQAFREIATVAARRAPSESLHLPTVVLTPPPSTAPPKRSTSCC